MECRSKLSTFEVAIRNLIQVPKLNCVLTPCIEGLFLIDFATHTRKKQFPCEAIHPGVDVPSLPNLIFFRKKIIA